MRETRRKASRLNAHLRCQASIPRLLRRVETALYRITQEALSNAYQARAAPPFVLRLEFIDGELCLTVQDDGRGFSPDEAIAVEQATSPSASHFGLIGINERVPSYSAASCASRVSGRRKLPVVGVPLGENVYHKGRPGP